MDYPQDFECVTFITNRDQSILGRLTSIYKVLGEKLWRIFFLQLIIDHINVALGPNIIQKWSINDHKWSKNCPNMVQKRGHISICDDFISSLAAVHHQFISSSSSVCHQFIISSSSLYYRFIISSSSVHGQFIISSSSVHGQFIMSSLPARSSLLHHQFIISSLRTSALKALVS